MSELAKITTWAVPAQNLFESLMAQVPAAYREMADRLLELFADRPRSGEIDQGLLAQKVALAFFNHGIVPGEVSVVYQLLDNRCRFQPLAPEIYAAIRETEERRRVAAVQQWLSELVPGDKPFDMVHPRGERCPQ